MGYWKDLMIRGQSPRYCLSTEDYNEAKHELERDSYSTKYNNIMEEKLIPDWFYLPYCDVCK